MLWLCLTDSAQMAYDPLKVSADLIDGLVVHAVDGAQFGGKDELYVVLISLGPPS